MGGGLDRFLLDTADEELARAMDEARREEREACARVADNVLRACVNDDERDIAQTCRNAILARGLPARGEGNPDA